MAENRYIYNVSVINCTCYIDRNYHDYRKYRNNQMCASLTKNMKKKKCFTGFFRFWHNEIGNHTISPHSNIGLNNYKFLVQDLDKQYLFSTSIII